MSNSPSKVAYIWHKAYTKESDEFIPTTNRNQMVHSLIDAYGLLDSMLLISPKQCSLDQMKSFHSVEYLDHLKGLSESNETSESEEFGLEYDCPFRTGLLEYCQRIAGGTIDAAKMLCNGFCKVAIHWMGGWHHAKRGAASGFCYVNDCVLGLIELRKKFSKVLYIDLDVHHGDGVEDAFCGTNKVTTLSFHKFEPGFFPGTGSLGDTGFGRGKHHSINVPLLDGMKDESFIRIAEKVLSLVHDKVRPDVVLCQLGADGLNEDPMRAFNLTEKSFVHCVNLILGWGIPTLLVGGGGYNPPNTARCWTSVTASVLGKTLSNDIPEHDFFLDYGPHYELCIDASSKKDQNTEQYLSQVLGTIEENLNELKY